MNAKSKMREVVGDLWHHQEQGFDIVIPTNGDFKRDGANVMGRGVAQQAALRYPQLPYLLGDRLKRGGNHVYYFRNLRLFSFPVKVHWKQPAEYRLIEESSVELLTVVRALDLSSVYIPRVGCGNGGLKWYMVRSILDRVFDDRFVVVHYPGER